MFNFVGAIAIITSTILVQVPNTESVIPEYQMTQEEQIIHEEMALKNSNRYNADE